MTARSTRDGRRQSRMLRGNKDGFEVCTVNHAKGGEVRIDAKCSYAGDTTIAEVQFELETTWAEAGFRAYTPQEEDGCYIENAGGVLNEDEDWDEKTVCWCAILTMATLTMATLTLTVRWDGSTWPTEPQPQTSTP